MLRKTLMFVFVYFVLLLVSNTLPSGLGGLEDNLFTNINSRLFLAQAFFIVAFLFVFWYCMRILKTNEKSHE